MDDFIWRFNDGIAVVGVTTSLMVYIALYLVFRHASLRWLITSHVIAAVLALIHAIPSFVAMPLPPMFASFQQFHFFLSVAWTIMFTVNMIGCIWFLTFLLHKRRQQSAAPLPSAPAGPSEGAR